ncbi:hypothetical protein C8J57DRAFT_1539198 [Mycena rebaudengoi]|nr:hypothetical protein C8J57DRAFT_1539198 [Mycena rebaudengoi]
MTSAVQLEKAQAFISALRDLDADAMAAFLSPDFSRRIFPLSLGGLGKVVRDKAEFLDFAAGVKELVPRLNLQAPMSSVQGQDAVVIHVSVGQTTKGKPFNNEYIFTIRFCGEQIYEIREFMDSKYVTAALADAGAELTV